MRAFTIPLRPKAQRFSIQLSGVTYNMTWRFNSAAGCWMLDIADVSNVPLVNSLPLVTGRNLLDQLEYIGISGALVVQTDNDPDAVPTFENLGKDGRVYYVVEE